MNATTKFLNYFKCAHCATWAISTWANNGYVTCNGCGGSKKWNYRQIVNGEHDEQMWAVADARGVAHLPLPDLTPTPCQRCDTPTPKGQMERRPDGLVCRACYRAEERPTPPKMESLSEQDDLDRMEAAYAALEQQS